jgi:stage III sporulation protein SpoIIIAA
MSVRITDDIDLLIDVLPPEISQTLREANRFQELLEVIIDLGRVCEARFATGEVALTEREIEPGDIEYVVSRIGLFGGDNRAGIERTLHRISAMRNRRGEIVGLTCRVGRAVYGTIEIISDIVESGQSILLLGRPGVGKTTMLREVARVLAEKRRVVIVDTSNEIGGDGDIPHPAIGRARRMQVPAPAMQHAVMIEAVENHMPEVIVIDEIGTELEASAARTIAERGVQLVGTAHGNTLDNLMMNPTLCDLVGGIQTVTLGDEEARRRGTQKSVLERKAPPTFEVVVEIQDWDRVAVRDDVAMAADLILRGRSMPAEIRMRGPAGEIRKAMEAPPAPTPRKRAEADLEPDMDPRPRPNRRVRNAPLKVYPYGLNQNHIREASSRLRLPVHLVNDLLEADALFTLRTYYRKHPQIMAEAERRGVPIYVLRNNTVMQMESYLAEIFGIERQMEVDLVQLAMDDARQAIERVASGERTSVPLSPQESYIRRMQHQLAREANLPSHSTGTEPRRRVTIHSS